MDEQNKKSWLTEGVVIATAPLIGYLMTYSFQWGYVSYFGMPIEFISVDLSQVIRTTIGVMLSFLFLLSLYEHVPADTAKKNILYYRLLTVAPLYIYLGIYFFIHKTPFATGLFVGAIIALSLSLIVPIFTEKNKKSYKEKLEAYEEKVKLKKKSQGALSFKLYERFGDVNVGLIVNLIIILFFVEVSGEIYASNKKSFLVLTNNPNKIVLNTYNDKVICASLDRQTKIVGPSFTIYELSPLLEFTIDKVGPLKSYSLKQDSTSW